MQNVSADFLAAMENKPYIARLTLDGIDTIQGDAILKVNITGGANGDGNTITLGGTVAGSTTITLDKTEVICAVEKRKLFVEFGIQMGNVTEWLPMGTYYVTETAEDDDILTLNASDALASKFDVEYEPIEGFNFEADGGVDAPQFLEALCARRGVDVDVSNLESVPLKFSPEGFTERKIIGFIGALYGGFADIDRVGVLRICWYKEADISVDPDKYYDSGMEKASYDFTVGWIKCYVESLAETLALGDETAEQGIYFECPWMDEARLEAIWQTVRGFSYRPVTQLKFFGDPRIDPGDIIMLTDLSGAEHAVPAMSIGYEWDGGIITNISASGQVKTDVYEGPVTRETRRICSNIIKRQNTIELSVKSLDGDKIISLINLSETEALIQAPKIKFEGLVTANENFKVLEDGSIEAAAGVIGGCSIVDGKLEVPAANITGTVTAGKIVVKNANGTTLLHAGDNAVSIAGWNVDVNSFYSGNTFESADCFFCTGSQAAMSIGGSENISGWMIKAGDNCGVTKSGAFYCSDAYIKGTINAIGGAIGGWNIDSEKMWNDDETVFFYPQYLQATGTTPNGSGFSSPVTWLNIALAGNRVSSGISTTITVNGSSLTFTDGVLTRVA